jgi:hypothetical protein
MKLFLGRMSIHRIKRKRKRDKVNRSIIIREETKILFLGFKNKILKKVVHKLHLAKIS